LLYDDQVEQLNDETTNILFVTTEHSNEELQADSSSFSGIFHNNVNHLINLSCLNKSRLIFELEDDRKGSEMK